MSELRLKLLGLPQITHGGVVVTFQRRRSLALLAYLALSVRPVSRDSLAFLLAGDVSDEQARKHLRNALTDLRRVVGDHLVVTSQTIAFNHGEPFWLDVEELEQIATTIEDRGIEGLERAMALYEGELLADLIIRDASPFDEWLTLERERIHGLVVQIALRLVARHEERHALTAAIAVAQRLLTLEPWNEEGHRHLMRLLARDGQRTLALAQYAICRRILAEELGVEPDSETQALYERLRTPPVAPPHTLPTPTTPFVGRARELAVLKLRLAEPTCRIVTILGLGGSGKTRTAIEVARGFAAPLAVPDEHPFADGVHFISLVDIDPSLAADTEGAGADTVVHALATAIGQALGMTFQGNGDPVRDLTAFLRSKALLLVLDNFESMTTGAELLATLIAHAPNLTILATSRVRLGLAEEWVLEIGGLALPISVEDLERADSSRLFLSQVERLQLGASLTPADRTAVVRICALVEGLPLALRLAATWRRGLSCAEIATELERGIDLLATTERGLPVRHQSIRAVLATTWQRLSEDERQIVGRLSVFRNGFTPEAAQAVANADVRDLLRLRDYALMTAREQHRYLLHELVRQYAAEHLATRPDDAQETRQHHAEYFARFVHHHAPSLYLGPEARAAIGSDIANVRAAWTWAGEHRAFSLLETMQEGLGIWFELSGPYSAWEETLGEAEKPVRAALTDPVAPQPGMRSLLSALLIGRARALSLQGKLESVDGMLDEAEGFARAVGALRLEALVAFNRLHPLLRTGNFRAAQEAGERALALAQVAGMPHSEALTCVYLADFAKELGAFPQAEAFLDRAHTIFRELNDQQGAVRVANNRGRTAYERGHYAEATAQATEALRNARILGYRAGAMFALLSLGRINDEGYGRFVEAKEFLAQSLSISQELRDQYIEASILAALGRGAMLRGEFERARAALEEAEGIFNQFGDRAYGGGAIQTLAQVAYHSGDHRRAYALAQQALSAARDTGHVRTRRLALRLLGHTLSATGEYTDAAVAYRGAYELEQRTHNPLLEVDTLTGLARVALAQGKLSRATSYVDLILDTLTAHGTAGVEEPVSVYLTCHTVRRAQGSPYADAVLAAGHALLTERAAQFSDEVERRMFDDVPAHRQMYHEWRQRAHTAETDPSQGLQHAG